MRRTSMALAASVSAVLLAACGVIDGVGGNSSSRSPRKGDDITVGLLLPEVARYENIDYPAMKKEVGSLTNNKGKVLYANAASDAAKQSQQLDQMIADKVDVLVVGAMDAKAIAPGISKAKDAGIPVIAYDRLPHGSIDAYISFDKAFIGQMGANALVEALGLKAGTSKIVMMNGPVADPNAALYKRSALSEFQGKVNIVKSYDTEGWWDSAIAKANMKQAIQSVGLSNIAGVYAANDTMAGAAIDALKQAGVSKVPPVTGANADLEAVQRIISGDQYMSVYKPFPQEAQSAARMAVAKAQGRSIEFDALTREKVDSPTEKNIPSMLVPGVVLTKDNLKDTVIRDGIYTVKQICTAKYKADCAAAGLE